MGTPHRGTGGFTAEQILSRVVEANIQVERITQSYLNSTNDILVDLVSDFTKLIRDDEVRDRLPIVCFFETISTEVSVILKRVKLDGRNMKVGTLRFMLHVTDKNEEFVVDETSASLEGSKCFGLALNHFQLNKFSGPRDGFYRAVYPVIVDMVKKIPTSEPKGKNSHITQRLTSNGPVFTEASWQLTLPSQLRKQRPFQPETPQSVGQCLIDHHYLSHHMIGIGIFKAARTYWTLLPKSSDTLKGTGSSCMVLLELGKQFSHVFLHSYVDKRKLMES